ncbi:MAG TPA: hypothetical protein VNH21_13660 [Steroidobacteraceae bacterium]|nr:hypothetical protein [Steroidobacteraceae bacterium]
MTTADFAPIFSALIAGCALAITGLIGVLVPRAIAAFERRTGVALTDQQRAAVMQAARTEAGMLETALQQGVVRLSQVTPTNGAMLDRATAALARVPEAAAAVGTTPAAMASIIVGATDTTKGPRA